MSTKKPTLADPAIALRFDRLVRQIHVALQEKAPEFDTEHVGPGGGMLLLSLSDLGRVPMITLARAQVRDKSQMTRMVASLERKGLVEKTNDPQDNRVVTVGLTPKGKAFVEGLQHAIAEAIGGALAPLSPAEQVLLGGLLEKALGEGDQSDRAASDGVTAKISSVQT